MEGSSLLEHVSAKRLSVAAVGMREKHEIVCLPDLRQLTITNSKQTKRELR
jgi:hypothetical protein